jgi:hypothetical protein
MKRVKVRSKENENAIGVENKRLCKNFVPHDLDGVPVLFEERKEIEGKAEGQEKWDKKMKKRL